MPKKRISEKLQAWIDARKRHRLSHAHVQMARALGLNPGKLGKIDAVRATLEQGHTDILKAIGQAAAERT